MYKPGSILSENSKTTCSINLPIKGHCRPTKHCAFDCYARTGRTAYPASKKKQLWVSGYLLGTDISELIEECRPHRAVRISGSGDLLWGHVMNIIKLAQELPDTQFWGMTRKVEIADALYGKLPNLKMLVSLDSSTSKDVLGYPGKVCFGPRRAGDEIVDSDQLVIVFPRHFTGRVLKDIPRHPKDCPGVYHEVDNCLQCGRCWKW